MRLIFSSIIMLSSILNVFSQGEYFQQEVNVVLNVELDDKSHRISGTCDIEYINNSGEALSEIYFHLWGNAYKDRTSAFAKQQLKNRSTKFHFSDDSDYGNFENISFHSGKELSYTYYENNPDIVKVALEEAIIPGGKIDIHIPFTLKIPESFSRLGHVGTSYQMTQWYPKPAVYDSEGWHPMPYLNQGEFFSEFGDYEVNITLPKNYVIAATGELMTKSELVFLEEKIEASRIHLDSSRTTDLSFPASSTEMKTVTFIAENVHDFAWFADKRFYVEKDEVKLKSGSSVDTWVFYTDVERELWKEGLNYVNRAVSFYSDHVGEYPYPHATAVQSALSAGGGMEYPMITVIGAMSTAKALDGVITHEVGHNWFYGILAFNERDEPWLDEGINSYYDHRYLEQYWENGGSGLPRFISKDMEEGVNKSMFLLMSRNGLDQPPVLHSTDFKDMTSYFIGAYEKPAVAFKYLQYALGTDAFDRIMQSFYTEWAFKHPNGNDFRAHFEKHSEIPLDWFFDGLIGSNKQQDYKLARLRKGDVMEVKVKNKGNLTSPLFLEGIKDSSVISEQILPGFEGSRWIQIPDKSYDKIQIDARKRSMEAYRHNDILNPESLFKKSKPFKFRFLTGGDASSKHIVNFLPALGANTSDGLMLGLNLNNIHIPNRAFVYSITPLFGFGSQDLLGTAIFHYKQVINDKRWIRNINYGIEARRFHYSVPETIDADFAYWRLSPAVQFEIDKNKANTAKSSLGIRLDYWEEEQPLFENGAFTGTQSMPGLNKEISYRYKETAVLLPGELIIRLNHLDYQSSLQQNESFLKTSLEYIQAYQYAKGKYARIRLFAGGFLYHTQGEKQTSFVNKGNFGLSGEAFLDHHYQDFYFNRDGGSDQFTAQIHERDGGFKIPLGYAYGLAQSNRFLTAANLEISIPKLPNFLPVRLYVDLAYLQNKATAQEDFTGNLYYDLGLRIRVGKVLGINFPITQSTELNNILKSRGNYLNRISFTIDINEMRPARILGEFGMM